MAELKNEFTWSFSRNGCFEECLRKYFLNYYLSWGGWESGAKEDVKLAYRLKKLGNFYMWKGCIIHEAVESILNTTRAGKTPDRDAIVDWMDTKIQKEWKQSKSKLFIQNPNRSFCMEEHYYGGASALPESTPDTLLSDCIEQVDNFLNSNIYKRASMVNDRWISIERLDSIEINKVKCWVKLDFIYVSKKGYTCIMDWKTGKIRDAYKIQLGVYALFAQEVLQKDLEDVLGFDVFLKMGVDRYLIHRFDQEMVDESKKFIKDSTKKMKKMLANQTKNIPKSVKNFPRINEECVGICARCQFRQLCHNVEV